MHQLCKSHFEKILELIGKLKEDKIRGLAPKVKEIHGAKFTKPDVELCVSNLRVVDLDIQPALGKRMLFQAPGLAAVIAVQLSQGPGPFNCSEEQLARYKAESPHSAGTQPAAFSSHARMEDEANPQEDAEPAAYSIKQRCAKVEETTSRVAHQSVINQVTCPDNKTSCLCACTCGGPLVLGLPCHHNRAHAGQMGLHLHEVADHRFLASTWKASYEQAGAFGEVCLFTHTHHLRTHMYA